MTLYTVSHDYRKVLIFTRPNSNLVRIYDVTDSVGFRRLSICMSSVMCQLCIFHTQWLVTERVWSRQPKWRHVIIFKNQNNYVTHAYICIGKNLRLIYKNVKWFEFILVFFIPSRLSLIHICYTAVSIRYSDLIWYTWSVKSIVHTGLELRSPTMDCIGTVLYIISGH